MSNFLAIASSDSSDGVSLLRSGIDLARRLKGQSVASTVESATGSAAVFARRNATASMIATDAESGSWLLAAGSWFHRDGYGSGAEDRLLSRYLVSDVRQLAREVDGFFCIVIGDGRTGEMLALTDVVGSYHCFVRKMPGATVLSGSSLLLAGLRDFQIDPVGCHEFLATGVVYEDRTCYADVRKLGPGSIFRVRDGIGRSVQRYWDAKSLTPESLTGERAVRQLWESLTRAAGQVGGVFSHIVCDLTGGYDSRATIAAFLGNHVPFSTTVSGPVDSADVRISAALAQRLGVSHQQALPGDVPTFAELGNALALTDGEYDLIEYAHIARVHGALLKKFDISINGSFGELARGYWWELLLPRIGARRAVDATRLAKHRYATLPFDRTVMPRGIDVDLVTHFAEIIQRTNAGLEGMPNTLQMDNAYLEMRMQRWQGRIASSTNQLWPCLSPFMFRPVLEAMLQTSSRMRLRSLLIRRMLATFQRALADFPLEHGYPASPLTWRNGYRFLPLVNYYFGRVAKKSLSLAGLGNYWSRKGVRSVPARVTLWNDPDLQKLLDPSGMRLVCLLDESRLAGFLERARQREFGFDGQWARVVTLEYALQALEDAGARVRG